MKCYYQIKVSDQKRKDMSPIRFRMADSVEEAIDNFRIEAKHINRTLGFYTPELRPQLLIWKGKPEEKNPCKQAPDHIYGFGPRGGIQHQKDA